MFLFRVQFVFQLFVLLFCADSFAVIITFSDGKSEMVQHLTEKKREKIQTSIDRFRNPEPLPPPSRNCDQEVRQASIYLENVASDQDLETNWLEITRLCIDCRDEVLNLLISSFREEYNFERKERIAALINDIDPNNGEIRDFLIQHDWAEEELSSSVSILTFFSMRTPSAKIQFRILGRR